MPIPNAQAFTICSLRDIEELESITVNYAADKSYFYGGICGCATCNPDNPPVLLRRPINPLDWLPKACSKKTRRGGKRAKRAKRNRQVECVDDLSAEREAQGKLELDEIEK